MKLFLFLCFFLTYTTQVTNGLQAVLKHQRENVVTSPFALDYSPDNKLLKFGATISHDVNDLFLYYGSQMLNAWMMLVEWVNEEKGGILINGTNYSVSLSFMDDFSKTEFVETGFNHLLNENKSILQGLDFMLAPYSSSLTRAAQEIAIRENQLLAVSGASNPDPLRNGSNAFYTLPDDSDSVMAYFSTFADAGAKSIAVLTEFDLARCSLEDVVRASVVTGLKVESYDVMNRTLSGGEFVSYLNGLTADTMLVCSRQHLCEGVTVALRSESVTYFPKGIAMSPCVSAFHPQFTITAVPWSYELNLTCDYTGWSSFDFFDKYTDRYRLTPTYHAASTFASALILTNAVEKTQSFDTEIILEEISRNSYSTFYGNCTFANTNRQCEMRTILLQKILSVILVDETSSIHDLIELETVIYPLDKATNAFVYPAMTHAERDCWSECQYGVCSAGGQCVCESLYYGDHCELLCNGEVRDGQCLDIRTVYVGGLVIDESVEEYISVMKLAVNLVNNKTDGFFDGASRVHFEFMLNYTNCDSHTARAVVEGQEAWAESYGGELGGLIGPMCSEVSVDIADYGKSIDLPQVGFYAATSELSDPDKFSFYARTYPSSVNQAFLLTNMMEYLGLTPLLFVLYFEDYLGDIYQRDFASEWTRRSHAILGTLKVTSEDNVEDILLEVLQVGSPIVLMILPYDIAVDIVHTAHFAEGFDTSKILWVFSDYFITYDVYDKLENYFSNKLNGALFLYPYFSNNEVSQRFMELWANLDPEVYIDRNGDRSKLSFFSSYIVDSVASLAGAYQLALDESTYNDGSLLRERVYFNMVNNVAFDGLSGLKSFNTFGDLRHPQFNVQYVGDQNESFHIGNINDTAINIDLSSFSWLDGSQGATSLYSEQLRPLCQAGEEPVRLANANLLTCSPCAVGTFKPHYGYDNCFPCHEGMDCNDVGITVPCLLPGYWRPPDEAIDSSTYTVYTCDVTANCIGGCMFNESCAPGVDQTSPTCGVCAEGYAATSNNECEDCTGRESYYYVIFIFFCSTFALCIFVFLWFSVKDTVDPAVKVDSEKSISTDSCPIASSQSTCDEMINDTSRSTTSGTGKTASIYTLKPIRYIAKLNVAEMANKIDLQTFTTNSITTFKLLLSFYLIMTQVVFNLNVEWPKNLTFLFRFMIFHRPEYLSFSFCTSNGPEVYFDMMLFFFLMPIASVCVLIIFGFIIYIFRIGRRAHSIGKDSQWIKTNTSNVRTNILRIALIFGLTVFPIVTSDFLLYFDCRDFGDHGSFLRQDYSVECTTDRYRSYVLLAIFGIIVYGLGIPIYFYYVVSKRDLSMFVNASIVLHRSFKNGYKQFEIVALLHKVILFSLVYFVATPGSSSQCLFLLLTNLAYFVIIAICRPYDFRTDTILALTLTAIECFAFLVAFLVISGVAEVESYSMTNIYDILYSFMIVAVCMMAPCLYAMKYSKVNDMILLKTGIAMNSVQHLASRSSKRLSDVRSSFVTRRETRGSETDLRPIRESTVELSNRCSSSGSIA